MKKKLKDAIEFIDSYDGLKKQTYSFRCNPTILAKLSDYARVNHTTLPKLLNCILFDFVNENIESADEINFNVDYIELPLIERTLYMDGELKSLQKKLDDLTEMHVNLKNEINRELLKRSNLGD